MIGDRESESDVVHLVSRAAVSAALYCFLAMRRLILPLLIQLVAVATFAQVSAEFGRGDGGTLEAITKTARHTSGSLGLWNGRGYDGSLGGQLLADRLWFFASASILPRTRLSNDVSTPIAARATAQPVDWSSLTASFSHAPQTSFATTPQANGVSFPQSFLSLRSTTILSDRTTLDISISQRRTTP